MKPSQLFRKLTVSAELWLLLAPFCMAFSILSSHNAATVWMWSLLPAVPIVFSVLMRLLPSSPRKKLVLPCAALCGISTFILSLCCFSLTVSRIAVSLLPVGIFLYSLYALSRSDGDECPAALWYAGVAIYIIAQFVTRRFPPAARQPLNILAMIYPLFLILELNKSSLQEGVGNDQSPSFRMLSRNRITLAIVYAAALAAANIKKVVEFFESVWSAIKAGITALAALLSRIFSRNTLTDEYMGASDAGMFSGLEGGKASPFWEVLEKILTVAALILAAAALCFALWKLFKALKKAIALLIEKYRKYVGAVSDTFDDKVESIVDWKEVRQKAFGISRVKKRKKLPWDKLTQREKVRQAYWLWMQKEKIPKSKTAEEALSSMKIGADVSQIYDLARYSDKEISPCDADVFLKRTK